MNNTVHIWFNGRGVFLPENNDWEKFGEVDALRTFLICADSWTRNGWEVKRLSTVKLDNDPFAPLEYTATPFLPNGRAASQYHWYFPEMWQYIAKCKAVAGPGLNVFCSMDVINNGFTPAHLDYISNYNCASFQVEHFSLSCFAATLPWLEMAEQILLKYDSGELKEIRGSYVSDERILREYFPGRTFPWQKFACSEGDNTLIHFSRSCLARIYRAITTS